MCLFLVSVNHSTSLSLTLEELLIPTALYWLAQNKLCFLAVIFSDLVVVQAFRPQLSPHPNACLTSLLLRVIPDTLPLIWGSLGQTCLSHMSQLSLL